MTNKNPWKSNTLEWTTPIEPTHGNWPGNLPVVHRWAYDYNKDDREYVMQHIPLKDGEVGDH